MVEMRRAPCYAGCLWDLHVLGFVNWDSLLVACVRLLCRTVYLRISSC